MGYISRRVPITCGLNHHAMGMNHHRNSCDLAHFNLFVWIHHQGFIHLKQMLTFDVVAV